MPGATIIASVGMIIAIIIGVALKITKNRRFGGTDGNIDHQRRAHTNGVAAHVSVLIASLLAITPGTGSTLLMSTLYYLYTISMLPIRIPTPVVPYVYSQPRT
jgi:hypothetical protein